MTNPVDYYRTIMLDDDARRPVSSVEPIKGALHLSPAEQIVFKRWKELLEKTYQLHGFNPLDLPPFVNRKQLLKGGLAPQVFSINTLPENKMTPWGLAYDRTVPFAIWVKNNMSQITFPYKRYDVNLSFRDEQTRPGRFNAFYQADIDIVGKELPITCDVECITTLVKALLQLGVPSFEVFVNHLNVMKALLGALSVSDPEERKKITTLIDNHLTKMGEEEILEKLLEIKPDLESARVRNFLRICSYQGDINEFPHEGLLSEEGVQAFLELKKTINLLNEGCGKKELFIFAPGIVRGLDYYTGIVFESFMKGVSVDGTSLSKKGSIMSGGRYDQLVDEFTKERTGIQGVGGSIGLSRLFDVLNKEGKIPAIVKTASKTFVLFQDQSRIAQAIDLANSLRNYKIPTDVYSGTEALGGQIQYAKNYGVRVVVIVRQEGTYAIRDLEESQQTAPFSRMIEVVSKVKEVLSAQAKGKIIHTRIEALKTKKKSEASSSTQLPTKNQIDIGAHRIFTLDDFQDLLLRRVELVLGEKAKARLEETRKFIDYALEKNLKIYGLTTGFADLRDKVVSPEDAGQLSINIIRSHDAGIGEPIERSIVRGAMILRANALSKGNSGFQEKSLQTLIGMINHDIIPEIGSFGSLGASGDLAPLARLGRAMQGDDVEVFYRGEKMMAGEALSRAQIKPFVPSAKEGLALTNGTSFMASMGAIGYLRQLHLFENMISLVTLYANCMEAVDAAFSKSIQNVRHQAGQTLVADILRILFEDSPFIDKKGIQDDYSLRCLPQIIGAKLEPFLNLKKVIFNELDAVTDNPLIFKNEEISSDVPEGRRIPFGGDEWSVLSGGNFHGETLATALDTLRALNSKLALTLERHMTVLNNPSRNKNKFPAYLIGDEKNVGLLSGFMIPQYTGNGIAQKICDLADPVTKYNMTSGNESEDIVSYGYSSGLKWLEQLKAFENLIVVYTTMVAQAYSLKRDSFETPLDQSLLSERLFSHIQKATAFPMNGDRPFDQVFKTLKALLATNVLREEIGYPLTSELSISAHSME
jgi:histidine ammonia-lyase